MGGADPTGVRHATGTLRPIGLAGLNTFPDPEPVRAVSPARASSPAPLSGAASFVLSSRPARRGTAKRAPQPAPQQPALQPMHTYAPPPSFVGVPSLTVIPPTPAPAPAPAAAPMRFTITTPAQAPAPAPAVDTAVRDALQALKDEVASLRAGIPPAPAPAPAPAAPAGLSDGDILAMLAQAAAHQPQPQHITIRQEGHSLDGGAIMQALQSLGANMAELHTAQACTRSELAAATEGTNSRVTRSHMQLASKSSRLQSTADAILEAIHQLALEQGQDEGGIAAVAAATAGHVGSTVGNAVAAGLAELKAAQDELSAAVREALSRPVHPPPAAPPREPEVTEMWEEYSSAGGDSSDCNASSSSGGSTGRYETLDEYIGTAEATGRVPAVYGAAYSRQVRVQDEMMTLDEYLSDGEVAPGDDHGELSDGEIVTTAQADVSFISSQSVKH